MSTAHAPAKPRPSFTHKANRYRALNSADDSSATGSQANLELSPLEHAREKMDDIQRVLQGCPFFVVDLLDEITPDGAATTKSNAIPFEFTCEVSSIIVSCMLSRKVEVQRYLQEVRAATRPIIILCVDEGVRFPTEEVLDAQQSFLDLGASDVVLQRNCGDDLLLEIRMRVQSAWRANHVRRAEVDGCLQEQMTMLWPYVHVILDGFPELNKRYDSQTSSRQIQERVQSGTFGTVYNCRNTSDGHSEIAKVLPKGPLKGFQEVAGIWKEIVLVQKLEHPNVVAFKGAEHTSSNILIFMDFAGPLNLEEYLKAPISLLNTKENFSMNNQILAGLGHCHEKGVAHRDLKPANIVLAALDEERTHVRIVDFGLAIETAKACKDFVGTVPFIAPEVVTLTERERYDPARADMWSCGVVFLELLCGIGKINRMLHWSRSPSSRLKYRRDLERFFCMKNRVTASVQVDIGLVGSASFPTNSHASLLGMLNPDPRRRWNATKTIQFLTQEIDPAVSH